MKKKFKKPKLIVLVLIIILVLINLGLGIYLFGMRSIDNKKDAKIVEVTIENGMSVDSILDLLKEKDLIRNKLFSKIYVKLINANMQAGIYDISTNYNSMNVINMISGGKVTDKYSISITFKEGKNIRQYAKVISDKTNNTEDDVYNTLKDSEYINELIEKYWFLTDEIENKEIYYPLEGYLFPDTYKFFNKDVSVKEIFNTMLNKMNQVLSQFKEEIEEKNMSVHEFITLASIVELEGLYNDDRAMIAGVFYNRLKSGDSLGSDVTTYYAVGKDMGLEPVLHIDDINYISPYNTRLSSMAGKLPIGPIGNPGISSIKASIKPTDTDNYFFVADCTTNKTVFTKTFNEHVTAVNRIKASGCVF